MLINMVQEENICASAKLFMSGNQHKEMGREEKVGKTSLILLGVISFFSYFFLQMLCILFPLYSLQSYLHPKRFSLGYNYGNYDNGQMWVTYLLMDPSVHIISFYFLFLEDRRIHIGVSWMIEMLMKITVSLLLQLVWTIKRYKCTECSFVTLAFLKKLR